MGEGSSVKIIYVVKIHWMDQMILRVEETQWDFGKVDSEHHFSHCLNLMCPIYETKLYLVVRLQFWKSKEFRVTSFLLLIQVSF